MFRRLPIHIVMASHESAADSIVFEGIHGIVPNHHRFPYASEQGGKVFGNAGFVLFC